MEVGKVLFFPRLHLPQVAAEVAEQVALVVEGKAQVVLAGLGTLLQQAHPKEIREEVPVQVAVIFIPIKVVQVVVVQEDQDKELAVAGMEVREQLVALLAVQSLMLAEVGEPC